MNSQEDLAFSVEDYFTQNFKATLMLSVTEDQINSNTKLNRIAVCELGNLDKREYCLTLKRGLTVNGWPVWLSVELDLISCNDNTILSFVNFSIFNNGTASATGTQIGPTINKSACVHNFYRISTNTGIPILPLQSRLIIACTITFVVNEKLSKNIDLSKNEQHIEQVPEDFGRLFNNEHLSDVILKAKDATFYAHKVVLSMRSPIFDGIFRQNKKEYEDGVVCLSGIEPEILHLMLSFIYTGQVECLEENALQLYKAACEYDLEVLKTICETIANKNINLANVIDTLVVSDLHTSEKLKTKALTFIKQHISEVIGSPEFGLLKCSSPHLLEDIIKQCIGKNLK